jgi:hypothetical protein
MQVGKFTDPVVEKFSRSTFKILAKPAINYWSEIRTQGYRTREEYKC